MMTETSASEPPAGDRPASAPESEAPPAYAAPAGQDLLSLRLQHFDRAQAVTKTGSWEWDLQTNLIVWSDQVYRIFGLEPGDIEPSFPRFLARVHPDDRPEVEATIQRAVSGQAGESLEHRIITPGGEVRAVRQVGVITSDAQGRPTQMTGAITDVTEQRRVLDEHRETRQMLDSLLRGSPEAIVVTNGAGEILIFSAGAEAMFGYRSAEMEGQPIEALLPEAVREVHRRHVQAFAAEPGDTLLMHQRTEIRGRRRNGETFPAEASLKKLTTRGGHIFTAIVRDLTQVRAAEQRLVEAREQAERANRAKSSFLANMSHEIRTPLNGVLGITGALARTGLSPAQAEMVALIETSGKALEGLLSDILDLAKVEAGFIEIHDAPLDLARVLHETASLFQARAADKGLLIQVQLTCEVGATFRGDELRIRQVLSNLVSNAIKFTKAGEVRLSLACAQGEEDQTLVTFTVTDTGIGFDPELGSQLFERFEQGDASITRKFGGTGLGLAISKALVDLMGGSITAHSEPGQGSRFAFTVPLRRCAQTPAEKVAASSVVDAPAEALRVLLAEDHPINRRTVELILDNLPVDLTCVEDGEQAVEAFAREPFDVVLMDMQMSVMDGLSAVRCIRALELAERRPRTPICMVTANALEEHRREALAAGADELITKPLNAETLIDYLFSQPQGCA